MGKPRMPVSKWLKRHIGYPLEAALVHAARPQCIRARDGAPRALSFRPRGEHEVMHEVRRQQKTAMAQAVCPPRRHQRNHITGRPVLPASAVPLH